MLWSGDPRPRARRARSRPRRRSPASPRRTDLAPGARPVGTGVLRARQHHRRRHLRAGGRGGGDGGPCHAVRLRPGGRARGAHRPLLRRALGAFSRGCGRGRLRARGLCPAVAVARGRLRGGGGGPVPHRQPCPWRGRLHRPLRCAARDPGRARADRRLHRDRLRRCRPFPAPRRADVAGRDGGPRHRDRRRRAGAAASARGRAADGAAQRGGVGGRARRRVLRLFRVPRLRGHRQHGGGNARSGTHPAARDPARDRAVDGALLPGGGGGSAGGADGRRWPAHARRSRR